MAYSVLLVEDHAELAATTGEFLELCGYIVDYACDGHSGLNLATENDYDALILDIMLPGINGYEICRKVREDADSDIPVLMLTARDQLQDKLEGFDMGADDYLIKPFDFEELDARLKSIIKRHKGGFSTKPLKLHDLELDLKTMQATRAGKTLKLSPTGLQILKILMRRSPELVTREELERELWGDLVPNSDVLRSHLYNLRKVIDKPFDVPLIETVPSLGFKISVPNGSQDK